MGNSLTEVPARVIRSLRALGRGKDEKQRTLGPGTLWPLVSRTPAKAQQREAVPRLRDHLLPRSILGLTALILAFSVGAGFSGALLYSYYEFKKDRSDKLLASYVEGFDKRFKEATATIRAEGHNARAEIQRELEPLRQARPEAQTLEALVRKLSPSLFFISTLDEAGQPSVGSAVAVTSDAQQTLLLTSFATVRAATRQPGPPMLVRNGNEEIKATLWTWHEERDMALIVLARGKVPTVSLAGGSPKLGDQIFAVSGLGGSGGAITQGFVADVSASGIQHDVAVGPSFQGGPLVNADGAMVALASRAYAPLGFGSDQVHFAPTIAMACERVLKCPGGGPATAGDRPAPAPR